MSYILSYIIPVNERSGFSEDRDFQSEWIFPEVNANDVIIDDKESFKNKISGYKTKQYQNAFSTEVHGIPNYLNDK